MKTAGQKRAWLKYQKNKVKRIVLQFYPKDTEFYQSIKEKAVKNGGLNKYIKGLLEKDGL